MHTGILSGESATFASAMSLVFCFITGGAYWIGFRQHWILWGAAGLAGLCLYWGMLAVSSGPNPIIGRMEIAMLLREVLFVTYFILSVSFGLLSYNLWRWTCCKR